MQSCTNCELQVRSRNVFLPLAVSMFIFLPLYLYSYIAQTAVKYTSVLRQVKHPGYIMDWDEAKTKACEHHIKTRERYMYDAYDTLFRTIH